MLGENIRELRKEKGITQEELAVRLHVVRQTVSKWEKNLSVPDAVTLQNIADELDTDVSRLLGEVPAVKEDRNELAQQLARINEQLAVRNRRSRRIWTVIAVVFALLILIPAAGAFFGAVDYSHHVSEATTLTDDPVYTETEVREAFDTVKTYFNKNYKGCTMESLSYDETASVSEAEKLTGLSADEEALIILTTFKTGKKASDTGLPAETRYKDWKWVLVRTAGGPWRVLTEGR
ncbi:MAG: helix-turn-helix domain-containing protein [Solobacterium sp.]|nr:helix-turn-helix domain-containing protein [Solobacterium sp.]